MNILEDLWRGNVCFSEKLVEDDKEYIKEFSVLTRIEDLIYGETAGTIKEDIKKLVETQQKISCITDKNAFAIGVRFGVKMMIDTLCS